MKTKLSVIFLLCLCLIFAVSAVYADDGVAVVAEEAVVEEAVAEEPVAEETAGFKVIYLENDCLAAVPTDENVYAAGDEVTALFEPVTYRDYLIFFGWDLDDDGVADLGYDFNKFEMPEGDIELKAICLGAYGAGKAAKSDHCRYHCKESHDFRH